ncbi:MFS transporter [Desulfosporosinus sp. FKB]|uniref:MFS transporter n=1 Tax=Desulfosporosinus sp. FKB TaxID=1969835 RepID=UPI000B497F9F|nr:MFS transporter [Desulfosporosinus sp. FKB]
MNEIPLKPINRNSKSTESKANGTKPTRVRTNIVILTFLSIVIAYMDRANLSVASVTIMKEHGWNTAQWGSILSAFFVGYLILQIPAGWIADKIGGKRVLAVGVAWWSIFTAVTPFAKSLNSLWIVRALMGLGEAVTFPAETAIASNWVPSKERARSQALNLSGMALSLAVSVPISAWIISTYGWPAAFYFAGLLGLIWTLFWLWYAKDRPSDHPKVNQEELVLIGKGHGAKKEHSNDMSAVLKSGPVWALAINYFFQNYSWYLYLTWLPGYLVMARHFSILKMGIYGMLPYLGAFVITNLAGYISDRMIPKIGVTRARKYIMYAAFGGSALFLYLGAMAATGGMAVLWITLAVSFLSMNFSSFWALPIDLGPKNAGLISGLMNTFGTIAGIIAPIITGFIVNETGSWVYALSVAIILSIIGIFVCALFVSGKQVVD